MIVILYSPENLVIFLKDKIELFRKMYCIQIFNDHLYVGSTVQDLVVFWSTLYSKIMILCGGTKFCRKHGLAETKLI